MPCMWLWLYVISILLLTNEIDYLKVTYFREY